MDAIKATLEKKVGIDEYNGDQHSIHKKIYDLKCSTVSRTDYEKMKKGLQGSTDEHEEDIETL